MSAAALKPAEPAPQISALSPIAGAEITGIDLRQAPSAALTAELRAAILQHKLVIVRDQHLDEAAMETLARGFGEIEGYRTLQADGSIMPPVHRIDNFDKDGKPSAKPFNVANYFWHSDLSHNRVPSFLTMLNAIEIPPEGGDTEFANLTLAYAALPEETKQRIAGLKVEHSYVRMRELVGGRPASAEEIEAKPPSWHPLVRTHPETGEKALYSLGMYCSKIAGMPDDEAQALLAELLAHATRPQFVFTQIWQPHDLAMWDNRCLMHRAIANFDMSAHRRVLMRINVAGTEPYE